MRTLCRKSAPRVKAGRVQKKNNWTLSPDIYRTPFRMPLIDRQRPGEGYVHVLTKRDVERFIALLPDWQELSRGLNAIVLAPGSARRYGYHYRNVVHVCAWDRDLWQYMPPFYYRRDRAILERLRVPCEADEDGETVCKFTETTARAFSLLDTLLHELGHHRDKMTTRRKRHVSRGEPYAEEYARLHARLIWDRYCEAFGIP
jgi:hypothetical protein